MNIDYQTLKEVVDNSKFESYEQLSYLGIDFLLFPCKYTEKERRKGVSPVFFRVSQIADWDIYFSVDVVDEEFQKPVLLHEILEAYTYKILRTQGMERKEANLKSHEIAKEYDDRYAKEKLDKQTYRKYCEFRKKWLNSHQ